MKFLNVVFYSPPGGGSNFVRWEMQEVYVNPTPYYLHSYFKQNNPELKNRVKWAPSILHTAEDSELISYIEDHGADVFCASVYMWNVRSIFRQIELVRKHFGDTLKIVIGGPSCEAFKHDWNIKYPFVDYFVIGQGEKAWSNIVLELLNERKITEEDTNIVHFFKDKQNIQPLKQYSYEFLRGIHFSPYVECEDMVKEYNLEPIARMVSYAAAGVEPRIMGIGPVKAIPKALKQGFLNKF
jgi:radical SAM superfamily enzyme YgiQ (UPF0313 family)